MNNKIKFDKENVKKLFSKTSTKIVLCSMVGVTVITSTTPFLITELKEEYELNKTLSSVQYVVEDKTYSLDDLYYVENEGKTCLCYKELIGSESHLAENIAISTALGYSYPFPFLGPNDEEYYGYFDVNTNGFICMSTDDELGVVGVCEKIKKDFHDGNIGLEEINSNYIEENISDKNK